MSVSALSPKSSYDTARADAFAERFLAALNDSAMVMMSSLGHRAGLFDVMAGAPPSRRPRSPCAPGWPSATCASGWR
jgi:hypothetical protein